MTRTVLYETVLVLLIATLLAAGSHALRPEALPLLVAGPAADTADEAFKAISIEAARQMFAEGGAVFADARPPVAYEEGHIRGAIPLEPGAFDQWADKVIANYALDQPIIAYCEGEQCQLSHELAERLTWLGFTQVYYLVDGWGQWQSHHLPVESFNS
ncbi:MAG: rhodanese-like domain-containing protein [Desulfatitalea sp.]